MNDDTCEMCQYCKYPRTTDDNSGACKCKLMKYKTIDVYVGGGNTPQWCPLKDFSKNETDRETAENR